MPFDAFSLNERPLGGTETAVIRMAAALAALGNDVRVISDISNPRLSEPIYLPKTALADLGEVDVLIAVRDWQPLLLNLSCKIRMFWTGDAWDQPQSVGIGDLRVRELIDCFLAVSNWQADTLAQTSGFPREKCFVMRNGIHLADFIGEEKKITNRFIYSSTPYRGLALLPGIYRELCTRHQNKLELHVFSGYDVYSQNGKEYNPRLQEEFEQLSNELSSLPGCVVHGNIKQKDLAKEFKKAGILAYPNTFPETSCITAMEAQAGGCPIVTSTLGALPETVGKAGILIPGDPNSDKYQERFTNAVDTLLKDSALYHQLSTTATTQAKNYDWSKVAEGLQAKIKKLLN